MTSTIDNGGKQIWDCQGERCEMSVVQLRGEGTCETFRECQSCGATRLLVLFPRTEREFYSKICQLCTTKRNEATERDMALRGFRRRRRLTPLSQVIAKAEARNIESGA